MTSYEENRRFMITLKSVCQTYTHIIFSVFFVQVMSYSIAIALEYNVSFINLNDRQMYLHTHTNLISLTFSFKR